MKIIKALFATKNRSRRKTITDYKEELVLKYASEQIKKLTDRGLTIPVAYL